MKRLVLVSFLLFLCVTPLYAQYHNATDARRFLLNGVERVGKSGVPGPLLLTSEKAFPVLMSTLYDGSKGTIVAGGFMERGAVLAFGHPGFLADQEAWAYDTLPLLEQGVVWAARDEAPRILVRDLPALAQHLRSQNFQVTEHQGAAFSPVYLQRYDVVLVDAERLSDAEVALVRDYVKRGGGLLTAGLGWGWLQLNPGKNPTTEMKANLLLADAGIQWIDGYMSGDYLVAEQELDGYISFADALAVLRHQPFKRAERASYTRALQSVMQMIPHQKDITPFALDNDFPGTVAPGIARVTKTLPIDAAIPRWHSTGLYAPPGEPIHVRIPAALVDAGLAVRIGAHTDKTYHLDTWTRHPELSLRFTIDETNTTVFNPFGGLVYVDVPSNPSDGVLPVTISGVIEAPHFVLGETRLSDWNERIRYHQAPWAELEGDGLIITLQSHVIRDLERPDEVIQYWNQAQENNRALADWPTEQNRPMRIVFDRQISAGYMHSGYPIMSLITPNGEQEAIINPEGDHWGFFHELGHNHQHTDWTFDGTVEVTCNLFTFYNVEHLQQRPRQAGDQQQLMTRIRDYFDQGAPFDQWKQDPFLALEFYNQLLAVYGWEALKSVIHTYTLLPQAERPTTDQQKRDLWLVTYSRQVGRNLSAYFDQWGIPVSAQARQSLYDLPPADLAALEGPWSVQTAPKPPGVLEQFKYRAGFFIKRKAGNGTEWVEQNADGEDIFFFTEYGEDDTYFYLRKHNTTMNLRIPKKAGWLQISYGEDPDWGNLYHTSPF